MPVLSNQRWERFAQELAKGKSATEAYATAGYRPNGQNAARLTKNDGVHRRVAELQERGAVRTEITIEKLTEMLIEDRNFAREVKQAGAARAASETLARLHGHMIDRKEIRTGALDALKGNERESVLDAIDRELARREGGSAESGKTRPH